MMEESIVVSDWRRRQDSVGPEVKSENERVKEGERERKRREKNGGE